MQCASEVDTAGSEASHKDLVQPGLPPGQKGFHLQVLGIGRRAHALAGFILWQGFHLVSGLLSPCSTDRLRPGGTALRGF